MERIGKLFDGVSNTSPRPVGHPSPSGEGKAIIFEVSTVSFRMKWLLCTDSKYHRPIFRQLALVRSVHTIC